jgi:hypothetical protein
MKSSQLRTSALKHSIVAGKALTSKPGMSQVEKEQALMLAMKHLGSALAQVGGALALLQASAKPVDIEAASADLMSGIEALLDGQK